MNAPNPSPPSAARDTVGSAFYLPDFCSTRIVFLIVLIAELVALVLTLAGTSDLDFWSVLARTSFFLLWIGLGSAVVLCLLRSSLARLPVTRASAMALLLILATTLLVCELAFRLGEAFAPPGTELGALFPSDHGPFLVRCGFISLIIGALVLRYFYVTHEWRRNVEMEARSRIHALQARIRPHFLFNSMNTIAALTRSNPRQAEEAVEDLADLFRANLSEARAQIPLKEELEVARIYQRIEELRLGKRLKVEWRVNEVPMRALVPSLLIQPLLENAIYHGIERLAEGGTVVVAGERNGNSLKLSVANPVPTDSQAGERSREGNRIAIANITQRLELAFPGESGIETTQSEGQYVVTLTFPCIEPS
jgi:two-component system sensor histidine kinase AlgZ